MLEVNAKKIVPRFLLSGIIKIKCILFPDRIVSGDKAISLASFRVLHNFIILSGILIIFGRDEEENQ